MAVSSNEGKTGIIANPRKPELRSAKLRQNSAWGIRPVGHFRGLLWFVLLPFFRTFPFMLAAGNSSSEQLMAHPRHHLICSIPMQ
jgi:hypothetical protein